MRVALYLRRSTTDLQPDSLKVQEEVLRAFADRHHHEVVEIFRDSASGRRVKGRDDFRRLIDLVQAGAPFQAVLVRDVSRWSRAENLDEAGYYEWLCRSRGVDVIYVEENFGIEGTPYAQLMKSLKRYAAAEYSRERATLVQDSHVRLVRAGFWPSGAVPYALKRVRVNDAGDVLGDLRPGERKALANERVKFAPGEAAHVAVVRRIFEQYANGWSLQDVARQLNEGRIPSPRCGRWTPSAIGYIISNEAYVGTLRYCLRRGDKAAVRRSLAADDERLIRCRDAHPALIAADTWKAAQAHLRAESWRKDDAALHEELRTARQRWQQSIKAEATTAATLRSGYGRVDREVIGPGVDDAVAKLRCDLGQVFHVTDFEGGLLLDHLLHVTFIASLPHVRFAGLHWSFEFSGRECANVILGLAFSPPRRVEHVETFFFRLTRSPKPSTARPLLDADCGRPYRRIVDVPDLVVLLRHAIRFRGTRAEEHFLKTVRGRTMLSLRVVANELGWPAEATRVMYRKLELRGEAVPPLRNGRGGKRITVTCPHCFRARSLSPATVLSLKTDVCFECLHRPPVITPNRVVAECPACGARRLLRPSEVAALVNGTASLCGKCSRAKNCSRRWERAQAR